MMSIKSESEWQRRRNEAKLKMSWPSTQNDWLARWNESLDILGQKVDDLRNARDMYNYYIKIVFDNPQLDKRNEFLVFIEDMYLNYVLVKLRAMSDTNLQSHSLYNLIDEVLDHVEQLPKEWFIGRVKNYYHNDPVMGRDFTCKQKRLYEDHWGQGPYPSADRIRDDLCQLNCACEKARSIVNEHIAHVDRERRIFTLDWFKDIDAAIETCFELWSKYNSLITGSTMHDRFAPEEWEKIFDDPIRYQGQTSDSSEG